MFAEVNISYLTHSFSDHCPLLINTRKDDKPSDNKLFKFEAWWIMEDSFGEEVQNIWERASGGLLEKLDNLKTRLQSWVGRIRIDRRRRKELLINRFSNLAEADRDDINLAEMIDTKIQLNFEIDKDERYWEQRARINWLKFGDRNTAFFHSQASLRRRRNCIHKLRDDEGNEIESIQEMEWIPRQYFQNLFTSQGRGGTDHLLSGITRCISE
ncbi:hypothetical protein PVK06_015922 [Gossypium arboreum]|uniref:Reverse transcriptase n=1 Tax=Gossypium arboreum TaxID=29729 RepID=A0ABR0PYS6_GOSAR|nr:hypothetical protein PVK06_015922 [Gossypium arboreum]